MHGIVAVCQEDSAQNVDDNVACYRHPTGDATIAFIDARSRVLHLEACVHNYERNEVDEWVDKTKFAFTHLAKTSAFSGVNG